MRMVAKLKKTCRANLHGRGYCPCGNAAPSDKRGRRQEKRIAKARDDRNWKKDL